jgi:hypothetical protein
MKPKEALVKDGFLPPGSENIRGRMSKDAIARCEQLASQGWQIDGFQVKKSSDTAAPVEVERVKVDPTSIPDVPDQTRPEQSWTAHTSEGEVGMRTVCNVCRNSLTYCFCPVPKVWIDHQTEAAVYFKQR